MNDMIRRADAIAACQVGPSDEWSRSTKSGYSQAATDCAMNVLKIKPVAIPAAQVADPATIREAAQYRQLAAWLRNPWSKMDGVERGPIPEWQGALMFEAANVIEALIDTPPAVSDDVGKIAAINTPFYAKVKELAYLREAYRLGFKSTSDTWNGVYDFEDDPSWIADRDADLAKLKGTTSAVSDDVAALVAFVEGEHDYWVVLAEKDLENQDAIDRITGRPLRREMTEPMRKADQFASALAKLKGGDA